MASGKSSVGGMLAARLELPFIDLDSRLEQEMGMSIPEIFENKGALTFRKMERKLLLDLLQDEDDGYVLATGGGTPCYYDSMDDILAAPGATSVYLDVSITELLKRLGPDRSSRPMIAHLNDDDLAEYLGKHLFERRSVYNRADHKVSVNEKPISEVVDELERLLA